MRRGLVRSRTAQVVICGRSIPTTCLDARGMDIGLCQLGLLSRKHEFRAGAARPAARLGEAAPRAARSIALAKGATGIRLGRRAQGMPLYLCNSKALTYQPVVAAQCPVPAGAFGTVSGQCRRVSGKPSLCGRSSASRACLHAKCDASQN